MSIYNYSQFKNYLYDSRRRVLESEIVSISEFSPDEKFNLKYLDAIYEDATNFTISYNYYAEFKSGRIQPTIPFIIKYSKGLTANASVYFDDVQGKKSTVLETSMGIHIALDDLFNRVCCNKAFLSTTIEGQVLWNGTECFWPQTKIIPKIRFCNYNPIQNTNFKFYISTISGLFYSGFPAGDIDRIYLASLMSFLAKFWILFHEESHYWHGHLFFAQEQNINSLYRISENGMKVEQEFTDLYRTFEWQADRNASIGISSLLFAKGNSPFELPNYLKSDKEELENYFRIVFCTIGAILLIFQKNNTLLGASPYYPSIQTRLTSMLGIIQAEIVSMNRRNELWIKQIDEIELRIKLITAIHASLLDMLTIEDIITDYVSYDKDILKSNLDIDNINDLKFIPKDYEEIKLIAMSFLKNLDTENDMINKQWFEEYKELVGLHNYLYEKILPSARKKSELSGNSPY